MKKDKKIINKKTARVITTGIITTSTFSCLYNTAHANEKSGIERSSLSQIIFGGIFDEDQNTKNKENKIEEVKNVILGGVLPEKKVEENNEPGVFDFIFGSFKSNQKRTYTIQNNSTNTTNETLSEKQATNIPLMLQTDSRWSTKPYGNSTIGPAGCGPTSVAMVVSGLTGQTILPDEVSAWAGPKYKVANGGSSWALFPAAGEKWGLKVTNITKKDPERIKAELRKGNPIIVSMSKGIFTSGGHIMVLAGIDENDKVIVKDPNSEERSSKKWDFSIIMEQCSKNGDAPFWAYSK